MKKIFTTLSIALATLTITSCGEDGLDGEYFIRVNNAASISSYWDNNSCIPYNMTYNYYYGACDNTGSFSYEYYLTSGGGWTGTYSVSVTKGESGKTFRDGEDAPDRYYTLSLYSTGMNTDWRIHQPDNNVEVTDKTRFLSAFNTSEDHVDVTVDMGGYKMHITGDRLPIGSKPKHTPKYIKN